jgi:epoxyqueuosine reductase
MPLNLKVSLLDISAIAEKHGLKILGINSYKQTEEVLKINSSKLKAWQDSGYSAEMTFMQRDPEIYASLSSIVENYRSVISFIVPYFQGIPSEFSEEFRFALKNNITPIGYGRIARYAWGRDYHKVIRKKLKSIVSELMVKYNNQNLIAKEFSDSVPILERALAQSAKLGFIGKNTLMITPRVGSFNFIGEIILNAEILDIKDRGVYELNKPGVPCKACTNCLSKCPTDAFPEPGVLNANRCIAYLTIEKRTSFTDEETTFLGDWLFGCDVCQDVCPFNHKSIPITTIKEFLPPNGIGPFVKLSDILNIHTHEDYIKIFAGTPLVRTKRAGLIRNAIAVLSNQKNLENTDKILELAVADEASMVRDEAVKYLRKNLTLLTAHQASLAKKIVRMGFLN